jgi:hypothetical protein
MTRGTGAAPPPPTDNAAAELLADLMARECGGCRTRVVTRAEFMRWKAKAEIAMQQIEDLKRRNPEGE